MLAPALASGATIVFDHAGGYYESSFKLKIFTRQEGAAIYYTTNGDTPNPRTATRYGQTVPVSGTTIVRAAAFADGKPFGEVATRTFLFPSSLIRQTGAGWPEVWGTNGGQLIPAHYTLSVNGRVASTPELLERLRAIPTLSIVTDSANLFSSGTGIYLHPTERGEKWERAASLEFLDPQGRAGFQINCGLRIHGGMSRRPEESPKHSFRLAFKRQYGPAKLRVPLFGADGPQEFDDLILRAGSNDSWLTSDGSQRGQATYLRDEWMRRSMDALGHRSARGIFVHLYLNGLYWGLYNLCESPGAQMLGPGAKNPESDILKGAETESGDRVAWDEMMALADSGLSDERRFQEISRQLDLPQFMDYILLNLYAGNADWDRSANWYAIRPRTVAGRFSFHVWDAEAILGHAEIKTLDTDDESPLSLFHQLAENTRFRAEFAQRVERLFAGPLAAEAAAQRFRSLADSIAKAMPLEAARWGSYRRDLHQYKTEPYECYTVESHWQPEVNRISTRYFLQRQEALLHQLRERGISLPER